MKEHVCRTSDDVEIRVGLRVQDYDHKWGVVSAPPQEYEFKDETCWPCAGHNGHWWAVCVDQDGHVHGEGKCSQISCFDGSRLSAYGWR